jgi:murein peptide amidase A
VKTTASRFAADVEPTLAQLNADWVERLAQVRHGERVWSIYCVRPPSFDRTRPVVFIAGGVHGDEPAGVYAALAFLTHIHHEFDNAFQFVVFPCVNPSGFDADTLETASGANLNRLFGRSSRHSEIRAVEDWLRRQDIRFRLAFDLHEVRPDYIGEGFTPKDNPHAAYLYETVTDGSPRIGRAMIDALPPQRAVCQWATIYDDINDRGLISYPQGARNKVYAQGTTLDGFLTAHNYCGHAFTLETPTGWPLRDRVATQLTLLKTALRHTMRRLEAAVS